MGVAVPGLTSRSMFAVRPGGRLWKSTRVDVRSHQGSSQLTTASPVADPSRQFVFSASPDGFVHKLAIGTGRQAWATRVTFDPRREKLGTALNVSGNMLLVT